MKLRVQGPDALSFLERVCANRIDRPVGTVVYTAMLTPRGGIRCDLTVTRHDEDAFLVVTGVKMALQKDEAAYNPERDPVLRIARRVIPVTSDYHDSVTVSGRLTDNTTGQPVPSKLVTFTLNNAETCSGTTNSSGVV